MRDIPISDRCGPSRAEPRPVSERPRGVYRISEFRVDSILHRLYRGAELLSEDERTVEFLWLLIRDHPRAVSKADLLEALWPTVVVSEWSLSRLASDTRQLLGDNGEDQRLIRTIRGTGFKLLPIPESETEISSGQNPAAAGAAALEKSKDPKETKQNLFARRRFISAISIVVLALCSLLWWGSQVERAEATRSSFVERPVSLHESMQRLQVLQEMSYTAFKAQVARREELVQSVERRLDIKRSEQYEKFFSKYFPQLNAEERFAFDQIRALTTGHLQQANRGMLAEIERNPELLTAIPSMPKLRQHLLFWLTKYENVFLVRPDMCVLYAGVEDGVPYPTEADQEVAEWLKRNDQQSSPPTEER